MFFIIHLSRISATPHSGFFLVPLDRMLNSATLSPDGLYRYDLTRVWDPQRPMVLWCASAGPRVAPRATPSCWRKRFQVDPVGAARAKRENGLWSRYRLRLVEYEALLDAQGDCHETGRVRGLLCARCNTSLGLVEREGLAAIARYLNG